MRPCPSGGSGLTHPAWLKQAVKLLIVTSKQVGRSFFPPLPLPNSLPSLLLPLPPAPPGKAGHTTEAPKNWGRTPQSLSKSCLRGKWLHPEEVNMIVWPLHLTSIIRSNLGISYLHPLFVPTLSGWWCGPSKDSDSIVAYSWVQGKALPGVIKVLCFHHLHPLPSPATGSLGQLLSVSAEGVCHPSNWVKFTWLRERSHVVFPATILRAVFTTGKMGAEHCDVSLM